MSNSRCRTIAYNTTPVLLVVAGEVEAGRSLDHGPLKLRRRRRRRGMKPRSVSLVVNPGVDVGEGGLVGEAEAVAAVLVDV